MIAPLFTLLAGTATHAGTQWIPSTFKNLLEYMKFLTVQGNKQAMEYHKLYMKDVEQVRGTKDKFIKNTRRYIAWGLMLLIIAVSILGGFTHFAFFTTQQNGWLIRLFAGPTTTLTHHFSHTFVLTPSLEQGMFYVLGFFLGIMGNK